MDDKSQHVLRRFPDKCELIRLLMSKNPDFFTICEDYGDCINALHHWRQSSEPEVEDRVNEYQSLVDDLEKEIVEVLAAADIIT